MKFNTGIAMAFSVGMSIFINGCKKDDATPSITCYLASVVDKDTKANTTETQTISYNSSNAVTSTLFSGDGQNGTVTPVYDAQGRITRLNYSDKSYFAFSYNSNGLQSEVDLFDGNGNQFSKTLYIYNDSKQLVQQQNYGLVNGVPPFTLSSHYIFTYSDTNSKNVITSSEYVDIPSVKLTEVDTYEYDTHKTPTSGLDMDATSSANNVTKVTTKNASGTITNTETHVYTYNENDYPLTENVSSTGNSNGLLPQSSIFTYTYNCK